LETGCVGPSKIVWGPAREFEFFFFFSAKEFRPPIIEDFLVEPLVGL